MTKTLTWAIALCLLAGMIGCKGSEESTKARPADTTEVAASESLHVDGGWVKGYVRKAWPYRNGEMLGLLGTKDGIHKGDILILAREGATINTVEVLQVQEEQFYGRACESGAMELLPQVGDAVMKAPRLKQVTAPVVQN